MRRPHNWWPLPCEAVVLVGLVVIVATWEGPRAELEHREAAYHLGLLQFVAFAITLLVGSRSLFDRDEHFAIWQIFLLLGVSNIAVLPIMGAHGLVVLTDDVRWGALGWIAVPLTALGIALPKYEAFRALDRRRRARMLAPLVVASVVAAAITALWPAPTTPPGPNPFLPAERY